MFNNFGKPLEFLYINLIKINLTLNQHLSACGITVLLLHILQDSIIQVEKQLLVKFPYLSSNFL